LINIRTFRQVIRYIFHQETALLKNVFFAYSSDTPKLTNILYVVDTSNGVSDATLEMFKKFVSKDLLTKSLGEDSIKAGLLVYGSDAVLQIAPTHQKQILDVAISNMQRVNGQRNFKQTFDYIIDSVLKNQRFVDTPAKKVIVLMVDGTSPTWSFSDADAYKDRLRAVNAEVVVIATSPESADKIKKITENPDRKVVLIGGDNEDNGDKGNNVDNKGDGDSRSNGDKTDATDIINQLIVDCNGRSLETLLC